MMAHLHRIFNSGDSQQAVSFTFLLPYQTSSRIEAPEILSREFNYAGQKWRLLLSKRDGQHLSPYLELCKPSLGLSCTLDIIILLLNRDSFTQNEKCVLRSCNFSVEKPRHGMRTFVTLNDLELRKGFASEKNEYLLEVTLKSPVIVYQTRISLSCADPQVADYRQYDTDVFLFGSEQWRVIFCPNVDQSDSRSGRHWIQLKRLSKSNHLSKLCYTVCLGNKPNQFRSKRCEEIVDFDGNTDGIYFQENYVRFADAAAGLTLSVELISYCAVSHLKFSPDTEKHVTVNCVDSDRQSWCAVYSRSSEEVCILLYYTDLHNIPSGYLRYVNWKCSLLPVMPESATSIAATGSPYAQYYTYALHSDRDKGIKIRFPISKKQLYTQRGMWLEVDGRLTVEIEWINTQLLFSPSYHTYDDVTKRHVMQMRREVEALQKENSSLEKELHTFQMSMAHKWVISDQKSNNSSPGQITQTAEMPIAASSETHIANQSQDQLRHSRESREPKMTSAARPVSKARVADRYAPGDSFGVQMQDDKGVDSGRATPSHSRSRSAQPAPYYDPYKHKQANGTSRHHASQREHFDSYTYDNYIK